MGETRVANIDTDNTRKSRIISEMFDSVRDELLQKNPWNFAIKRIGLPKDAEVPTWGFENQFSQPVDFLALLQIQDNPTYRLEGNKILTDHGAPLNIRYISRVVNTGEFDPLFNELLAAEIAVESVEAITQSNTKKQILIAKRDIILKEAIDSDAIQELPQVLGEDEWVSARNESIFLNSFFET